MKGNFDKTLGMGTQRTSYELWRNIQPLARKSGVDVEKVEVGFGSSANVRKTAMTLMLPFYDFSKYDIVHALIPVPHIPRSRNTKILTTVNEFCLYEKGTLPYRLFIEESPPKYTFYEDISGRTIGPMIRRQMFGSDYMSVNSTQTKVEAIKLGYPKERIFIVPHGVDERFLTGIKAKPKHRKFRVGFIGALNVRKNLRFAIDAFKRIKSDDVEFEIWGNKVLEYDNLVDQAGGDSRIKFMGFAPEEKLVSIYDRFDAFIFPSVYEGFGLPIIEAQARGLPVVICRDSMIPKEVRKYCLEAADEADMARLIEKLKEKGYAKLKDATRYARGFTRKKEAQNTLNLYKKIYSMGN